MRALITLWATLIRFGFRMLYHEFAFTYDLVSRIVSFGAWRCWGRTALKHLNAQPGDRILEIAYGTGNLQLDLHEAGYRVVGLDFSPQMARIASGKLRRANIHPTLTRGRAQSLPFPDATFTDIISTFPAEFIFDPLTLREVRRVMKPDGRLIIVPNATFTTSDARTRALNGLYWITGQRSRDRDPVPEVALNRRAEAHFAAHGLRLTTMYEDCPRSIVTVMIAEKLG